MNIDLLIEMMKSANDFENSPQYKSNASLEDFRFWLNKNAYERETPRNLTEKFDLTVYDLENEIAKQVILLGRYSRNLIKKALENHSGLANEDFTYLFRLMDYESLTKMQLIEKNAHEKQTGIEIIKRLVKNGVFAEKPDDRDKRSVRVSVTTKGKKLFEEAMNDITIVSKIMSGKLSTTEKETLLSYLKTLNTFHHTIYNTYKNEGIKEIEKLV